MSFAGSIIGAEFGSFEEAESWYNEHASKTGFLVNRDRVTRDKDDTIRKRYYICSRGGKWKSKGAGLRNRQSCKQSCPAHLRVSRLIVDGCHSFRVIAFNDQHNHDMLDPEEARLVPRNRTISKEDLAIAEILREASTPNTNIYRILSQQYGGRANTPFLRSDLSNAFNKKAANLARNDTLFLMQYLQDKKNADDDFYFEFSVDEEGRLEHIFWMYGDARRATTVFADVVAFDSTYKLNKYNMPFCPFVGVNHYGQTMLLGAALLREETAEAYCWVLGHFKNASARIPSAVLTDQDHSIKSAVATELPNARHAFCLWHIMRKLPSWFSTLLGPRYGEFQRAFRQTLDAETTEQLEQDWQSMCNKFNLAENPQMANLYHNRDRIASAYLKDTFFAGMTTTQRSESINAFFDSYMRSTYLLVDFLKGYDDAVEARRLALLSATTKGKTTPPRVLTSLPLERKAHELLTPYAFEQVQAQIDAANQYFCTEVIQDSVYHLVHVNDQSGKGQKVALLDAETFTCSCKKFEFTGFICRHIVRCMSVRNVLLPNDKYFPLRWRKDALESWKPNINGNRNNNSNNDLHQIKKYMVYLCRQIQNGVNNVEKAKEVCQVLEKLKEGLDVDIENHDTSSQVQAIVPVSNHCVNGPQNPPRSITKGRPKQSRFKHPMESSQGSSQPKKPRICRTCFETGHNSQRCPRKTTPTTAIDVVPLAIDYASFFSA